MCVCGCVLTQCCYRLTDFLRICPLLCAEEQAYSFRSGYIAGGYVVKLDISFTVRLLLLSNKKHTHKKKKTLRLKIWVCFLEFLCLPFVCVCQHTGFLYIILVFLSVSFFSLSLSTSTVRPFHLFRYLASDIQCVRPIKRQFFGLLIRQPS